MDRYLALGIAGGLVGVAGAAVVLTQQGQAEPPRKEYVYNVNASLSGCKQWQYIEQKMYNITLNNHDSIIINLSIASGEQIDVVEHRFYHLCNAVQKLAPGRFYSYVDGRPALPTIGIVSAPVPLHFAAPRCPEYGVIETAIWDTDDTRRVGFTEYRYIYEGDAPVSFRTIELYITKRG